MSKPVSHIVILGGGSAGWLTAGVLAALLGAQPASIDLFNRSLGKAESLAASHAGLGNISAAGLGALAQAGPFDLVINATSAGLGGETPPYPAAALGDATFCYDLSYALDPTPFSIWAREHGAARSVMGWGMLVEQAAESFHIWRGVRPDTAPVLKQMKTSA